MRVLRYEDVTVFTIDESKLIVSLNGVDSFFTRDSGVLDWQIHRIVCWPAALTWLVDPAAGRPDQLVLIDPDGILESLTPCFDVTRDGIHRRVFIATMMALRIVEDSRVTSG